MSKTDYERIRAEVAKKFNSRIQELEARNTELAKEYCNLEEALYKAGMRIQELEKEIENMREADPSLPACVKIGLISPGRRLTLNSILEGLASCEYSTQE